MREKSAYQYLLEKAQDMLRRTEGKQLEQGELPQGMRERLDYLEKVVQQFVELNDKMLQKMGATPDEIARAMAKPNPFLNEKDAATMRFGREVLDEARKRYSQISLLLRAVKDRGEIDISKGTKKVLGESRRRKFRRVGGKGKWMPM